MTNKRCMYIEVLRILACLAVIFNHTQGNGFFLFASQEWGSGQFYADLVVSIGCKFAVPVFFAISGALMLNREILLRDLWMRRIAKAALLLVVFSLASYMIEMLAAGKTISFKEFVLKGYEDELNYSYWFMYAYIAYLIAIPMLGTMLRHMRTTEIEYMLGVALVFKSILPALEQWFWSGAYHLGPDLSAIWLVSNIVIYPAMGYYLHSRLDLHKAKRLMLCLWPASSLGIAVCCRLTYLEYEVVWTPYIQTYHELFAGVYGATVFLTVRVLLGDGQAQGKWTNAVVSVGKYTLGVYLLHSIVIEHVGVFKEGIWNFLNTLGMPRMIGVIFYVLTVFMTCSAVTALLKKIPGVKWLLS